MIRLGILGLLTLAACSAPLPPPPTLSEKQQFEKWASVPAHQAELAALSAYLARHQIDDVVTLRHLVRSDVNWKRCHAPQFLVPPKAHWPHMVPTLRLLKEEVIPRWGAVEPQSVYRSPQINGSLGGARRSAHMQFHALDLKFAQPVSRETLVARLCGLHKAIGPRRAMGLGIYNGDRFHIDSHGFRSWGQDKHGASSPCRAIL